jgi:hypothetical protein
MRTQNPLETVLQTCLEEIQNSRESIDAVLARYPEIADRLRPPLETALWLQNRQAQFSPRPGFVASSRRRVIASITSGRKPIRSYKAFSAWRRPVSLPVKIGLALLMIFVIGANINSIAGSAQYAYPGEAFYFIKRADESVQLLLTKDAAQAARLQILFAQRRAAEIQELVLDGRYDRIYTSTQDFELQVDRAVVRVAIVKERDPDQSKPLASDLEDLLYEQTLVLGMLSRIVPATSRADIDRALEVTQVSYHQLNSEKGHLTTPAPIQ